MEMVYVAHKFGGDPANIERARKITHDLQLADLENCYVTPLLCFGHLDYFELSYEKGMELCLELLGNCDRMIVASEISRGVQIEIDYCKEWGIPVEFRPP